MIKKILILFLLTNLTSCLGLPSFANNHKKSSQIVDGFILQNTNKNCRCAVFS